MNYITMTRRIADNLKMLSSTDGMTITDGNGVTQAQIKNKINDLYREELFPLFSDKFPDDFKQGIYPLNTNTVSNTVSTSSSGYNLYANSNTFSNSMEGFKVQNTILNVFATIVTYVSPTQVILDTNIGSTWNNNTFYILGNEFTFGGDTTDIKEVKAVYVKYGSTDQYFRKCVRVDYEQSIEYGNETFSKASPRFYLTSIQIANVNFQAIGILPYPTHYLGKLKFTYIQRPPALLLDNDIPILTIPGISEVIINGVTYWGLRQQVRLDLADRYLQDYTKGKADLIMNYKPKVRSNPSVIRNSHYSNSFGYRYI